MRLAGTLAICGLALAAGSAALAQTAVISARSGLIHYIEGQVLVNGQEVESKFGNFPEVKENQTMETKEGRAEVLLTPGVFLRLGEDSSFRMITNRLIDTRLEFLSGSAIIEAEDIQRDNSVTVVYGDATIHIAKKGLYRFDSSPAELRVFDGLAEVTSGDRTLELKEGHLLVFDTLAMNRFDKNDSDALNRWSARRAEYVSMANVSAADSLRGSLFGNDSMYGCANVLSVGGWCFNPFFGMYTFVPGMGMGYSPYGFAYWSPFSVYQAMLPGYYYYPGYYYGYGAPYGGAYGGVYNTAGGYKSVPAPARSGGIGGIGGSRGSVGSVAVAHGPSRGSSGGYSSGSSSSSSGSTYSSGRSSGGMTGSISHGGGSVGSPSHR